MTSKDIWLMRPDEYARFLQNIKQETKERYPDAKPKELLILENQIIRERIGGTS